LFIPTILCGGAGSRLWPVSRAQHPKPFIPLEDGQSFLQKAFLRAVSLPQVTEILTVTNQELFFKSREAYANVNQQQVPTSYILEPFGRNTAAAMIAAAIYLQKIFGNEAIMLVLPADHLIENSQGFIQAVEQAITFAKAKRIVTFGIPVIAPETGYGYIQAEGSQVLRFIEKPALEKAQEYMQSDNYYWNSGMFCFTVGSFLQQVNCYCPEILVPMSWCMQKSKSKEVQGIKQCHLDSQSFAEVPADSIDYALMEKSKQVSVVTADMGWSDIGSWTAMADLTPKDAQGNRFIGEIVGEDVEDCYIKSSDRTIAALGIRNLMLIDTPDALLVADRSRSQEVKTIYNRLKDSDHNAHKIHQTVFRPWGSYTVLEEGPGFKIKRIVVNPMSSLSLQKHQHRSEHWVVVSGKAIVTNNDNVRTIDTNESTYIPAGNKHRLQNLTTEPVVLIEVQSGSYLGEDDIVRFEDSYGRSENVA